MVMSSTVAASRPAHRHTKKNKIIYWTATSLVCAVMVFSILTFTFHDRFPFPNGKEGAFVHLGLPHYFKIELTIAKTLGVSYGDVWTKWGAWLDTHEKDANAYLQDTLHLNDKGNVLMASLVEQDLCYNPVP